MPKTIVISATKARMQFFELLNQVGYQQAEVTIMKDGKPIAMLQPAKPEANKWLKTLEYFQKRGPWLTDEDVKEYQKIRKENNKRRFPEW